MIAKVTPLHTQSHQRKEHSTAILHSLVVIVLVLIGLLPQAPTATAHAILVTSTPAAKSTVFGHDLVIELRFNVRIDAARSRLTLLPPGAAAKPLALAIQKQAAAEILSSHAAGLQPGEYSIRWQVLASDGHITRGVVPFTVRAS